jgi:predicted ATP-grasp superfamily ATP-dependent carboligase
VDGPSGPDIDDGNQLQGSSMRIFVFEYVTGGGLAGGPMLAELVAEGDLMLRSLVDDLSAIPGVQVEISRDERLPAEGLGVPIHWVGGRESLLDILRRGIADADAVWPIAPETDGALEHISSAILAAGRLLLNSHPRAVAVASSKHATAAALGQHSLPVVPTWRASQPPEETPGCWVLKPDQGVGGLGAKLLRGGEALQRAVAELPRPEGWVVQPYLRGQAASLSLLLDHGEAHLLACNRLRVAIRDDGFALLGCEVNGLDGDREQCAALGRAVAAAIPGLWGFVGVDLIVTRQGPVVLEVNPRLTSCYPGLSRSLGANVAEMLVGFTLGKAWQPPASDRRPIEIDLEQCHVA